MGADGRRGVGRSAAALLATSVLALGACSPARDAAGPPPDGSGTKSAPPPAAPSPQDGAQEDPARPARLVRIALGGDVHAEGPLRERLRTTGDLLGAAAAPLARADLAVVNLETSVGTGGRPEPGKRFTFDAPASVLDALAAGGVDVAVQANNHALDLGRARLPSTLRAVAAAPLAVVGIGRDVRAAYRPAVTRVRGTRIATVAASVADQDPTADPTAQWAATRTRGGIAVALDPARLLRTVRRADREHDVVLAYLHWGVQGQRCPSPDQRVLARRLVAAGADLVVGTHAHQVQGDGRLGAGYVAYGLGNLAWYSPGPTGVLTLAVRPPGPGRERARVVRSSWWAGAIGPDGTPTALRGPGAAASAAARRDLRSRAGLG